MMNDFAIDHHLSRCATEGGRFAVLAIDHRDNLVEAMSEARGRPVSPTDVIAFKQSAIRHLADTGSAVLTDPDYGFPALVRSGIPARFGLLAPLEVTDYTRHPSERETVFIENWGVERIKASGCSGVKLLLYYHPHANNAAAQTDLVDRTAEACRRHDIPFFLEPIVYSLDPGVDLDDAERSDAVVETARHFSRRGVDVLKVQFPLTPAAPPSTWEPALRNLDDACQVPWALLSAGVSFDLFLEQTMAACKAGASGVMVGRAVWAEGAALRGEALDTFMRTTARARMAALAAVCELYGSAWHASTPRTDIDETWYRNL
ncbi:MAG: tagatose 1,6-diphosphate aldolase [Rhodothermales bacterium]